MLLSLQKKLNLWIGIILLTNLYLLTGITHIPYQALLVFILLISLMYLIINFRSAEFYFLINNWLVLCYLFFSVFLFVIDYAINGSQPVFNDAVRVLLYAVYFSWTFLLYVDWEEMKKYLIRICSISFVVLLIEGLFELFQPFLWTFLLSSNVEKRTWGRIGGTLIDSNSFACSLIIFFFVLFFEKLRMPGKWNWTFAILGALAVLYMNDVSGSRQGLLLIALFFAYLFFKNPSLKKIVSVLSIGVVLIGTFIIFENDIQLWANENSSTSIGRVFSSSNNLKSIQSNFDRKSSMEQGLNLLKKDYFLYGPGLFNFISRWSMETDAYVPHNGFLYLLAQYGIFCIPIFYCFLLSFKRSRSTGLIFIFTALMIHLFFQPNTMYYAITFFIFFYVDAKYRFHPDSKLTAQIKSIEIAD